MQEIQKNHKKDISDIKDKGRMMMCSQNCKKIKMSTPIGVDYKIILLRRRIGDDCVGGGIADTVLSAFSRIIFSLHLGPRAELRNRVSWLHSRHMRLRLFRSVVTGPVLRVSLAMISSFFVKKIYQIFVLF